MNLLRRMPKADWLVRVQPEKAWNRRVTRSRPGAGLLGDLYQAITADHRPEDDPGGLAEALQRAHVAQVADRLPRLPSNTSSNMNIIGRYASGADIVRARLDDHVATQPEVARQNLSAPARASDSLATST